MQVERVGTDQVALRADDLLFRMTLEKVEQVAAVLVVVEVQRSAEQVLKAWSS